MTKIQQVMNEVKNFLDKNPNGIFHGFHLTYPSKTAYAAIEQLEKKGFLQSQKTSEENALLIKKVMV